MTDRTWITEFGADYAIPEEIEQLVTDGLACDSSWHNDAMPSFEYIHEFKTDINYAHKLEDLTLRMFVDHEQPEQRERPEEQRYYIYIAQDGCEDTNLLRYSTDDTDDAVKMFRHWRQRFANISAVKGDVMTALYILRNNLTPCVPIADGVLRISHEDGANYVLSQLSEYDKSYAVGAVLRGIEDSPFAALHNICDANMLLPHAEDSIISGDNDDAAHDAALTACANYSNAIMDLVNQKLLNS